MNASHPDHRQWHPRSERTKGCAPSGSVSAALTSILLASPTSGPEPAAYAPIPPSCQSTGGKRHIFPSRALIPGDVRGPFPVRHPSREIAVGEVAGSRRRLAPPYEPYPRRSGTCAVRPSSAMIPRTAFSETRVRSMALTLRYPYPPLEAANTSVLSPAYLSMASLAWRQ